MSSETDYDMFTTYQTQIEEEHELKEKIRDKVRLLEVSARDVLVLLTTIHQKEGMNKIPSICEKSREKMKAIKEKIQELGAEIPKGEFYRFHDHWRFVFQRLSFQAALIIYLETEHLANHNQVCDMLGIKTKREEGFHLELEDHLMGLLQLASELSRFATNSVTAADYDRPRRICRFLTELDAGFRTLNLKNDNLRKRYDALKYDVKKVEEVVYDLSIRGLKPTPMEQTQ